MTRSNNNSENGGLLQGLCNVLVLISLVGIALLMRGCSFFGSKATITNTSTITNNTDKFIDKTVTIRSIPIQKIGMSSFTVSDARFFGGKPIVVVNASGVPFNLPVDPNVEVQVTGQVRNLVIPKIEQEFNLKLQDKSYADYINKPAIIARYILLEPKPGQVTQHPKQYYGRKVVVQAKVSNIHSPILLKLDKEQLFGGQDLLVLLKAPPKVAIHKGETLVVYGEVRPFEVTAIQQDYHFTWDANMKRQLEMEYGNKPVLVAKTVYPWR